MIIETLVKQLKHLLPPQDIITDPALCYAYGTDASMYRLNPKMVVFVTEISQVQKILPLAKAANLPMTFRAAGTSLSGQAISDGILVVLKSGYWRDFDYDAQSKIVTVGVGLIGAEVNRCLQPYQRKIGPDPASIDSCKIGGIVANNASGMCCGVEGNTYHTMHSIIFMLANGSVVDTADQTSRTQFRHHNPALLDQLCEYSQQIRDNPELLARIEHKYHIKNTSGYALNALTDYDDPIDILAHLMVGSEGTLGFISCVRYHTQPLHQHKADWLILFEDTQTFSHALPSLQQCQINTAELMDAKALLASLQHYPFSQLPLDNIHSQTLGLLIETQAENAEILARNIRSVDALLKTLDARVVINQTQDSATIAQLWKLRKGALPAIGGTREVGSTVVIEDVCVGTDQLDILITGLQQRFEQYGYTEGAIFGHALAGNLHFVFTPRFDQPESITRYREFMDSICTFVAVELGGSLKGEHGTGRNMAPYLSLEWGETAYQLMCDLKDLIDPDHQLNPDVIISKYPDIHLRHLKQIPVTHPSIDHCMECGFCEVVCPTRQYDVTPRQRIALARYQQLTHSPLKSIQPMIESCVATQLCQMRCPVGIDTSQLKQALLPEQSQRLGKSFVQYPYLFKAMLYLGQIGKNWGSLTFQNLPLSSAKISPPLSSTNPDVIYIPSCTTRVMGNDPTIATQPDIIQAMQSLAKKANINLQIVTEKICCGQATHQSPDQWWQNTLMRYSHQGKIPIVTDMSSCARHCKNGSIQVMDSIEWLAEMVLPRINVIKKYKKVALHITCSTQHLTQEKQLKECVAMIADEVIIPENISCCGFAGSRGFTDPNINASALLSLKQQVKDCEIGISTSRTCQIGLSRHSDLIYQHLIQVVDQLAGDEK